MRALLPPPPPPAQAERRALTWPALTACDTITGWGIRFRPRFRHQKRGQINVSPFFICSAGTPSCLGLKTSVDIVTISKDLYETHVKKANIFAVNKKYEVTSF